jgi:phospholipid/cholesterol/gamma-HCH transport system ATP-binding protein
MNDLHQGSGGQDRLRQDSGGQDPGREDKGDHGHVHEGNGQPAIKLEGVTKAFNDRKVLDDITLEVKEGIGFCLLGRSGTGKSVTLKHIMGLLQPDRGHVYVHGKDVPALKGRELAEVRRSMGFLFQNAALFDSISVGENVAFPMRRHTDWPDSKIREAAKGKLADVGLEKDYDKMPADLSGGMKKRAGLARAMALDPDILLVDEPTAGLDPITSDEIDDLLVELKKKGTTLLVVTHNIPSARHVGDEFAMLHEGKLIAHGTAEELDRSDNELVRAFMRSEGSG